MTAVSAPLTLQIGLRIRGSKDGPLADGDTVMKGDRIQVLAQTTEDAHLYLAYCTANRELTVFPTQGSILAPAGATTVAPGKEAYLMLDDHAGVEVLYVILSRTDLAGADPRLAEAIKVAQPGEPAADCGPRFEAMVTSSSAAESPSEHAGPARAKDPGTKSSPARSGDGSRRSSQGSKGRRSVHRGMTRAGEANRQLATIERGIYVSQDGLAEVTAHADGNGIAILRYRFQHVVAR
jgi:Domain of unknown function (DUF4384)